MWPELGETGQGMKERVRLGGESCQVGHGMEGEGLGEESG